MLKFAVRNKVLRCKLLKEEYNPCSFMIVQEIINYSATLYSRDKYYRIHRDEFWNVQSFPTGSSSSIVFR